MISKEIERLIAKICKKMGFSKLPEEFAVEHPADESFGDYSTNVAMVIFSKKKQKFSSPRELASEICQRLIAEKPEYIKKIEIAGPGFINFTLSEQYLLTELKKVLNLEQGFGKNDKLKGKKLMVEFAHPNTLKQFHIGHFRNICLGESLVRILEANGAYVVRTNYQGDVGLHVAKALWGAKKLGLPRDNAQLKKKAEFLGRAYSEGNRAYESEEKAKKEIMNLNKKIYLGDARVRPLWEKTRKWSLDYFDLIYKRVYTRYDRLYFESEVADPGKKKALEALAKGILKKSKGAVVFDGEPYGLHTRVFLTKENLPTYEGKELGLAALEFSEFGKIDKCIHVVGPEQKSFFEVTFKVEEFLEPEKYKGKQKHFVYGYVQLKKGKMSSRLGNVVTGEWLLDEAKKRVIGIMEGSDISRDSRYEVAEIVAVGAVKYSMLKVSPIKDIMFDFDESVNLEGDSGPYIQYTFARAKSVLGRAEQQGQSLQSILDLEGSVKLQNKDCPCNDEEKNVLRWLVRYPEVVRQAGEEYAPHVICTYLYELSSRFNGFYNKHSILQMQSGSPKPKAQNSKEETKNFRLALTQAVAQVLENGLGLLGIKAPEKM